MDPAPRQMNKSPGLPLLFKKFTSSISLRIIDALIDTPRTRPRLAPDKPDNFFASPKHIAEEIFKIVKQDMSAWSFRVELRPFREYW